MRPIELDGTKYMLPESWNEVTPKQLPKLIKLVYLIPESGSMHLSLIQTALNIKPRVWKRLHRKHFSAGLSDGVRRQNAVVLMQLVDWLSWMWRKPVDQQPFAEIKAGGHALLLPEAEFLTVSYGELTDLYIHLQAFIEQTVPGDERLNYLVATACRPRRPRGYTTDTSWNGDHREDYNEFVARERVKPVAKVDYQQRMMVLLYVASHIKSLMARYTLFKTDAGAGEAEAYAGQNFIKNQHLLAERGIFGNLKQTQQANAHEVLLFLEENHSDLLKQQADAEQNSH
jgi:hypothetical protein